MNTHWTHVAPPGTLDERVYIALAAYLTFWRNSALLAVYVSLSVSRVLHLQNKTMCLSLCGVPVLVPVRASPVTSVVRESFVVKFSLND